MFWRNQFLEAIGIADRSASLLYCTLHNEMKFDRGDSQSQIADQVHIYIVGQFMQIAECRTANWTWMSTGPGCRNAGLQQQQAPTPPRTQADRIYRYYKRIAKLF
jgi:hypothetical protein